MLVVSTRSLLHKTQKPEFQVLNEFTFIIFSLPQVRQRRKAKKQSRSGSLNASGGTLSSPQGEAQPKLRNASFSNAQEGPVLAVTQTQCPGRTAREGDSEGPGCCGLRERRCDVKSRGLSRDTDGHTGESLSGEVPPWQRPHKEAVWADSSPF